MKRYPHEKRDSSNCEKGRGGIYRVLNNQYIIKVVSLTHDKDKTRTHSCRIEKKDWGRSMKDVEQEKLFNKIKDLEEQAQKEMEKGNVEKAMECCADSLKLNEELLLLYAKNDEYRSFLSMLQGFMGNCLACMGRFDEARMHFEKSIEHREQLKDGNLMHLAGAIMNLGNCLNELGRYEEALGKLKTALDYCQETGSVQTDRDRTLTISICNNITCSLMEQQDINQVEKYLNVALKYLENLPRGIEKNWYAAGIQNNLGRCFVLKEMFDKAEESYDRALRYYNTIRLFNPDDLILRKNIITCTYSLANCLLDSGNAQEAKEKYEEVLELIDVEENKDVFQELLIRVYASIGTWYYKKEDQDLEKALDYYLKSISCIRATRSVISKREDVLQKFMERNINVYKYAIQMCIQLGRNEEALNLLEECRSRTLLDLLASADIKSKIRDTGDRALLKRYELIENEISLLLRKRSEPAGAGMTAGRGDSEFLPFPDERRMKADDEEIHLLQLEVETIMSKIKDKYPEYFALKEGAPLKCDDIFEALRANLGKEAENSLFVEYFVSNDRYNHVSIFLLDPSDSSLQIVNPFDTIEKKDVEIPIKKFREIIAGQTALLRQSRADKIVNEDEEYNLFIMKRIFSQEGLEETKELLFELYQFLFEPIREIITKRKKTRLIIVPDGLLHYIPFYALYDGDKFLVEYDNLVISVLQSGSVLPFITSKENRSEPACLVIAPLDHRTGDEEAKTVSSILTPAVADSPYLGKDGSLSVLKRNSPDSGIIYLIAHGFHDDKFPMQSFITFADKERLTVYDVYDLDLENCGLVVGSACVSALGKVSRGNEVIGLTRGFLYAGSPSYVGSLWPVETTSSKELMTNFCRNIARGEDVSLSLKNAMLTFMNQKNYKLAPLNKTPYFWAPFLNYGSFKAVRKRSSD